MKRSRIIAIAAVSSALALLCVTASIYIEIMSLTFATLSAIFVILPLTKKSWMASILVYIVVALSAFFIGGPIGSAPFIIFFGLYAVIQRAIEDVFMPWMEKTATIKLKHGRENKTIGVALKYTFGYLIKLIYLQIALVILWFALSTVTPIVIFFGAEIKLTYLIFSLGSIPLFLLYDLMMMLVFKNMKYIVNKKIPDTGTTTTDDVLYDSGDECGAVEEYEMREHNIFFNHDDENELINGSDNKLDNISENDLLNGAGNISNSNNAIDIVNLDCNEELNELKLDKSENITERNFDNNTDKNTED